MHFLIKVGEIAFAWKKMSLQLFSVNHTFVQCLSSAVQHAYLQGYVLIPYRK